MNEKRGRQIFGLAFGFVSAGILLAGFLAYWNYEEDYHREVDQTLLAVARLKVGELTQYRNERLGDGGLLFKNAAFSTLVRRFLDNASDADARQQLQEWMGKFQANYQYDEARLLDVKGNTRLVIPSNAEPQCAAISRLVPDILRSGKVGLEDFFQDSSKGVSYLALTIPVLDEVADGQPTGVFVLRINPKSYIHPFIQSWPTPSRTAETLLLRREASGVVVLSGLGARTNETAVEDIPASEGKAEVRRGGVEAWTEGVNEHGRSVMAHSSPVPNSPWIVVARMEKEEIDAPLRGWRRMMMGTVVAILLATWAGLRWLWRQHSRRFFRRQADTAKALRASEDRFRLVMAAMNEGVWDWDLRTGTMYLSPSYLAMLGFGPEELQPDYEAWKRFVHEEDLEYSLQVHQDCIENRRQAFEIEFRLRTWSGAYIWVLSRGTCLSRDEHGRAQRLVGTHINITGRKQMEEALRESEGRFRELFENSPDAVFVEDPEGVVLDINPAACRLHALPREELLGKNVMDLVPPESREEVRAGFPRWFLGELTTCEGVCHRSDGTVVKVDITGTPILYRGQKAILLHVRDITERKRVEEALRVSIEEFRLVLDNSNDAIFWADAATGMIVRCNHKTEELIGRSREELIGMHVEHLHPAGPDYHHIFRQIASVPSTENVETEMVDKAGKLTPVVVNFSVVTIGERKIVQGIARDITERKKAEAALRLLEEQRRLALAAGSLGTWDYNLEARTVFWDHRARAILGLSDNDTVRYWRAFTLMHPEDRTGVVQKVREAMNPETGGSYEAEYRVLLRDGGVRWASATGQVFFHGEGNGRRAARFIGTLSDITKRKEAEEALRISEEEFRLVLENSNDAIFWADAETGFLTRCNRKAEEMTGRSREELIGMHQRFLHPPEQNPVDTFRIVVALPSAENIEDVVLGPLGKRTPVLINTSVVTLGHRRIIQGIFHDITNRKKAEEQLRQAHDDLERRVAERTSELSRSNANLEQEISVRQWVQRELEAAELCYRTVANFTHDWEYWETPEHTLRYCSPSCERITGYSAGEFNANPALLEQIIHPDDAALWLSHREDGRTLRESRIIQFRICRKDRTVAWLEHVGQPVLGEDGTDLGIRGSNRDITDRIEKDLQNQRLRDELSNVGRVTTAGQLAASLAHELRQPLTAILCNVRATQQMLKSGNLDIAEVREALADIGADGERAGGVIRNLQAMFNKSAAEHRSISINALLQETVDLLRSEFVLQRVFVCLDFGAELPGVLGNHVELQQVILNLIFNAVEAMGTISNSVRRIHIRTRLENLALVHVSIQDSGPGIPEVQLSRMFEPFVTTKPSGMGMGLAICRTIIEAHGGRLWAANSPEGGAILEVVLQGQTGR